MKTITLAPPFEVKEYASKSQYARDGKGYEITDSTGMSVNSLSAKRVEFLRTQGQPVEVLVQENDRGFFLKRVPVLEDEDSGTGAGTGRPIAVPAGPAPAQESGRMPAQPASVPDTHSDMDLRIARGVAVKAAANFVAAVAAFTTNPEEMFWRLADDIVDYQFSGVRTGGVGRGEVADGGGDPESRVGSPPPVPDTEEEPDPTQQAEDTLASHGLVCKHETTQSAQGPLGKKGWKVCADPTCGRALRPDGSAA